jgi:hypothetical protein
MTLSMPGLALINLTIQGGVVISEPTHMEDVIIMGTASGTVLIFRSSLTRALECACVSPCVEV